MADWIPPPPLPSPIPTARGVRSAADPILSELLDRSVQIPELQLPRHVAARSKPHEISYESIVMREDESVRRFLRSVREFGVVRIRDHGIPTEELRFALDNSDRIFWLAVECCTSYGDHEKIVWGGADHRMAQEAAAAIGQRNYQIFRQKMENASIKLEAIARELSKAIIAQSNKKQYKETIQFGESKFSIYRYHRANINDRNSSAIGETSQESGPYALSLHLFLDSSQFCLESGLGLLSFETNPDTLVVTMGKELEEWSLGEIKSAEGKLRFQPFLHTNKPSFSLQQKWEFSKLKNDVAESDKAISLSDQILFILIIALFYKSFSYIFS
ncbi:hypothetical protein C2S52_006533 [Perilla frutescens var. hirtella]|nr:hypothetical protein C2S51_009274 [Perilla frutescens var. frutescens]KAH6786981.1 hypothetical protein C2S52_006533 [Perilla frutescens var. hirtella]